MVLNRLLSSKKFLTPVEFVQLSEALMVFFDGRFEHIVEMFEYIRNFRFYLKIINRFLKGKKLYIKFGNKWGKFRGGQLYKKASCLSPINKAKPYQNLNSNY